MHSTLKRVAMLGALGATLGIVAPEASASEAGIPGFPGAAVNGQMVLGPVATGAIIITTAPTSFINTNNQTSGGVNVIAGQVGP